MTKTSSQIIPSIQFMQSVSLTYYSGVTADQTGLRVTQNGTLAVVEAALLLSTNSV